MYDSEVYDMKERIFSSEDTANKLNELFLNNCDELIVFMHGGDTKSKEERLSYINRLVKRRELPSVQDEDCDIIIFSNKQAVGKYDLSDVFEIKPKYKEMKISDHSKEEIDQKLNVETEKLSAKLQAMTETERREMLESKKGELIKVVFDDMERPWVKIFTKHQSEIMTFLESRKSKT